MLLGDRFSHNFSNKQTCIQQVIYSLKLCLFSESRFENEKFSCILVALKKKDLIYFSGLSVKCQFGQMTSIILFREKNKGKTKILSIYSQLLCKGCNNMLIILLY